MKCETCKIEMIVRNDQRYHYVESGLDNVYLDGISLLVCDSCGEESPIIPRILDVHSAIGRSVALQQAPLRGEDVRFLRKQLGMRARSWAGLLKVSVETLSRWENGEQKIGPQSDSLFRLMYIRIREERETRLFPGNVVEQIASVSMSRTSIPVLLVDVNTLKVSSYLSLDEMVERYEAEMKDVVEMVSQSHSIPAGHLQRGSGFVAGAVARRKSAIPATARQKEEYLRTAATQAA
jgi:putative zinc finger/helix-turn-helix YgiT family protein